MTASPRSFTGFGPAASNWFEGLEHDNSKSFFERHRSVYELELRGPLEALLEELADEFGGRARLFRQNRDLRFSRDKSPYKTTTYGLLVDRPGTQTGLYAELSARGLYAGTGYHELASDQLARFRAAVAGADGEELERILAALRAAGLELAGEALRTAPRGFPRDHPRVALLRHRALVAGRRLAPAADGISRERALEHVARAWRVAAPMNGWLDRHVGASALAPEERFGRGRGRAQARP